MNQKHIFTNVLNNKENTITGKIGRWRWKCK